MAVPVSRKPGIFGIRDVQDLTTETHESGHELKRSVTALQLTSMGVGAIIGTGIFVVIGQGAGIAGPGVILSFVLAAVACTFSALSYAELASSIPVSGSAYTYSYATMGELVAWIIGWDGTETRCPSHLPLSNEAPAARASTVSAGGYFSSRVRM